MPALAPIREGGVHQQLTVLIFNDRRFLRRVPAYQQLAPVLGYGVVPGKRDEIFEKEFAHRHRIAAFAGTDHFHAQHTGLRKQPAAFLNGDQ